MQVGVQVVEGDAHVSQMLRQGTQTQPAGVGRDRNWITHAVSQHGGVVWSTTGSSGNMEAFCGYARRRG